MYEYTAQTNNYTGHTRFMWNGNTYNDHSTMANEMRSKQAEIHAGAVRSAARMSSNSE